MKVDIVPLDPDAVSYRQARELTALYLESFARDPMHEAIWGRDFNFLTRPPVVGAANLRAYRAFLDVQTYAWLRFFANPKFRTFLARNAADGAVVGFVMWSTPTEIQRKPSLLRRLKLWWTGVQKSFWNWWHFGTGRSPAKHTPEFMDFRKRLDITLKLDFHDAAKNKAFRAALAHKTRAELADTAYLAEDTHWCAIIAVGAAAHRQGVGRQLLQGSARQLPLYEPEFRDGDAAVRAPQQYALFATAHGAKLYDALGWKKGRTHKQVVDGIPLEYPQYFFSGQI